MVLKNEKINDRRDLSTHIDGDVDVVAIKYVYN